VQLDQALEQIQSPKVLLLGDFVLDQYQFGVVDRISPEAPVPVLKTTQDKTLPGGAGNVVLNLLAMGARVTAQGRVGLDQEGNSLLKVLEDKGADVSCMLKQADYPTSTKKRFIAGSQQLIRVDREENVALSNVMQEKVLTTFKAALDSHDIVAFSDYDKGFFTPDLLSKLLMLAKQAGRKVIIDPKGVDFTKYRGAFLIKPNEKEAKLAATATSSDTILDMGQKLYKVTQSSHLLITRSSKGMSLISEGEKLQNFPIHSSEVVDVTGAGDTVLSMLAVALASNLSLEIAAQLANVAAGQSIQHVGCYAPTLAQIKHALLHLEDELSV
jgi:D-glycero-beta-D-manno-heptose-7-phosphate kinase